MFLFSSVDIMPSSSINASISEPGAGSGTNREVLPRVGMRQAVARSYARLRDLRRLLYASQALRGPPSALPKYAKGEGHNQILRQGTELPLKPATLPRPVPSLARLSPSNVIYPEHLHGSGEKLQLINLLRE